MVLKRSSRSGFITHDPKDPRVRMAKKLASIYRTVLKGEVSVYRQPWSTSIGVELQSVFSHFLKAADIVLEEGGDPEVFIKAQFVGLKWARIFPYPTQLHTTNARLRFIEHSAKLEAKVDKAVKEDDFLLDEFEVQNHKLKRLVKNTGVSEEEALQMFGKQFTKAFLKSKKRKRS